MTDRNLLEGADEVLFVPTEQLVEESIGDLYRPNRRAGSVKRARKRSGKPQFDVEALNLYDGLSGFLVRTALIRAADYDPRKNRIIRTPEQAAQLCAHLGYADQEHVVVLALNGGSRLLAIHETSIGGTSSATAELKHVLKVPLLVAVSAVILVHNHPSGSTEFSPADIAMTRSVKEGMKCVGLTLVDHIVVARSGWRSYMVEYE